MLRRRRGSPMGSRKCTIYLYNDVATARTPGTDQSTPQRGKIEASNASLCTYAAVQIALHAFFDAGMKKNAK